MSRIATALSLVLVLGATSACKSTSHTAEMKNTVCPISGKTVDPNVSYDYMGHKIYLCCPKCADKVAMDPEKALDKAYPDKM